LRFRVQSFIVFIKIQISNPPDAQGADKYQITNPKAEKSTKADKYRGEKNNQDRATMIEFK
jgi:hypothetical protein